jgi:AmmeMemoRadiSam system protein A
MSPEYKKRLLELARKTLEAHFKSEIFDLKPVPLEFQQKRGVFVTLTKNGELRGCIGNIYPVKSIYQGIKENALNAAFYDPRFPPLKEEELPELKIEISLLTVPEKLEFDDPLELVKKLKPGKDGVILEKEGHQATFLPQVWEQIPDHYDFLRQLSWKAGLSVDAWKKANIYIYHADCFAEKE